MATGRGRTRKREALRAAPVHAAEDEPERGRRDESGDRPAVRHEREVDRVFAEAGDELLGSVQRVDERKASSPGACAPAAAFLRYDRDARQQATQGPAR